MSDATFIRGLAAKPQQKQAEITLPKPQPLAVPVFIHDCATPLGGETVLSLLMKRLALDVEGEP